MKKRYVIMMHGGGDFVAAVAQANSIANGSFEDTTGFHHSAQPI